MTLTCCQDHILTENIWFVRSKTSDSGDKWRCYRCGTNEQQQTNSEDRATQPMDDRGWVSQYLLATFWLIKHVQSRYWCESYENDQSIIFPYSLCLSSSPFSMKSVAASCIKKGWWWWRWSKQPPVSAVSRALLESICWRSRDYGESKSLSGDHLPHNLQ